MGEISEIKYLIVGGGAAAAQAAVGIREIDTEGSVLIVGREKWWPYDRPPLSKGMLLGKATPEDAESKDPSWYEKNNVQVRRGTAGSQVDRQACSVTLSDGSIVKYQRLLLATGATPKSPPFSGADLKGVHLFRTVDDSLSVKEAFRTAKSAVMIGTGYIGIEVASACLSNSLKVTLVDPAPHPWSKTVSSLTGNFLRREFEAVGATFHQGGEVGRIYGNGQVEGVELKGGERIPAELVVIGVGVSLNTELAKACGLEVDPGNGVKVDSKLRTADENVYAAGDIAYFDDAAMGKRWHAEHYLNARWQGKQAGRNMAGAEEMYDQVPYFFSDLLDLHMILRGDPQAGRSIGALGEVESGEYVELYARDDGSVAMGLAFSHNESSLDKISDALEKVIRERGQATSLDESHFGLGLDQGLG